MAEQQAIHLHYSEAGYGMPILLVHGFPFDNRIWAAQLGELGATYRVIAPDLRGFGQSAAPDNGYSMDDFAADLVMLLDRLGIERAVWVGHSMGGYITLAARRWRSASLRRCSSARTPGRIARKSRSAQTSAENVMQNGVSTRLIP